MTHTPEPWVTREKGGHPHSYVCGPTVEYEHGPDRPVICYLVGMNESDNADRIAACVNACAGIPTDQLAAAPVGALAKVVAVAKKYQDMSCEGFCQDLPRHDTFHPDMDCGGCELRAALAALRGGAQ